MRRVKVDELEIETTNRLVMEDTVVLWRVRFSNTGSIGKKYHVVFHVPGANNISNGPPEIRGTSEKWKMDAVIASSMVPQCLVTALTRTGCSTFPQALVASFAS